MPSPALTTDTPIHELKAELFKALAHPVRVRLLELLVPGERAVSDLLADTGLEASHLSQHLAVLRRSRVVLARRDGNSVRYRLADPSVADLLTAARTFLLSTLTGTRAALTDLEQQLENAAAR
ncbi:MAG TPA: metalloregulator ArsR/SmtB family transcription factor [Actinotalea sp.]